jgi:endo-1,4-beta-xylanase
MKKILLCLFAFSLLMSCKKKDTPTTGTVLPPLVDTTLQAASTIPIGCAIDPNLLRNNALYKGVILKEYNSVTAENVMKWSTIHPSQNTYNFSDADYIVDFCQANKKRAFGHVLLWHGYNPAWLETFQGDSTAFENLMKTHIQNVVGHFKGKIAAWDVVNEAFDDSGNMRVSESIWAKKLGKDYIARAFKYANEADPAALLFYNDYGQEGSVNKLQGILNMVADLKKRGIPIHGLGLQMHLGIGAGDNGLLTAISEYAKTGLKIHFSELDINLTNGTKNASLTNTPALQELQKQKYKTIAQYYNQIIDPKQQFGITTWNVGDADSWLRNTIQKNEYPLLFDDSYNRKPAYYGFIEGLRLQ